MIKKNATDQEDPKPVVCIGVSIPPPQKHPPFLAKPLLNLYTVQAPPLYIGFSLTSPPPKNWIFQQTPKILKFFITDRRLTGQQFLAVDLSPTFLKTGTTDETFQQSGKQSFRHILKSSASNYESPASQFFKTITGIQSGPNPFDESRFIMTFLTILVVIEILCSFTLVLEGKTGKEIPESSGLEFLQKFLANHFTLSEVEDNTSRPLNRGGIADLLLLRTLLAIH